MSNPHVTFMAKCAICGKVKKDANHWFIAWIGPEICFHCVPFESRSFPDALLDSDLPVCGQACAQRILENWMTASRNGTVFALEGRK